MRDGYKTLCGNDCGTCSICNCQMFGATVETYDIAQAYERVLKKVLIKDLDFLLDIATRARHGLQQVFHSTAAIASRTPNLRRDRSDRAVVTSKTILKVVLSYLEFRFIVLVVNLSNSAVGFRLVVL